MSGAQETPAPSVLNGQYNQAKGAVYEVSCVHSVGLSDVDFLPWESQDHSHHFI